MRSKESGETVETLEPITWLWPHASSIVAFTKPIHRENWEILAHDPVAMLQFISNEWPNLTSSERSVFGHRCRNTVQGLWQRFRFLPANSAWIDWTSPTALGVYSLSIRIARIAGLLAKNSGFCSQELAASVGSVIPLGIFPISSVGGAMESERQTLLSIDRKKTASTKKYPLDSRSQARSLARQLGLPSWLTTLIGFIHLPIEELHYLGVDRELASIVQLAVVLAEQNQSKFGLSEGIDPSTALKYLGLSWKEIDTKLQSRQVDSPVPLRLIPQEDPRFTPYLEELCRASLGIESIGSGHLDSIQEQLDQLECLTSVRRNQMGDQLKTEKLLSLAEFAAGASHEINNPLAVISGQSQYLLKSEEDTNRRNSLEAILRQVQRIHHILNGVMQFARPRNPHKRMVLANELVYMVIQSLQEAADKKKIQLKRSIERDFYFMVDAEQIKVAISCLLQNAIEAAPVEGEVHISVQLANHDQGIEIRIEDNGPGIDDQQVRHLFDPFFSGRSAGRGRGLGLPTAWRFARENGGNVRYIHSPTDKTLFVLELPLAEAQTQDERLIA